MKDKILLVAALLLVAAVCNGSWGVVRSFTNEVKIENIETVIDRRFNRLENKVDKLLCNGERCQ